MSYHAFDLDFFKVSGCLTVTRTLVNDLEENGGCDLEANLPDRRSLERRRDSADTYTIEGAPSREDEDDEAASTCQDITDVFDQTLTLGSSEANPPQGILATDIDVEADELPR